MAQKNVDYIIGLRDQFSSKMNKIDATTNRFNKSMGRMIGRYATLAAAGGVIFNSIKKMADFEEQVSNLSAITGATGDDLEYLKQKAIELGGATTKSSIDTIKAFKLIASGKPELLENGAALAQVTKEAIALSEASGLDLPDAAKNLVETLNQFSAGADQASRFINVLAAGSKLSAAEIPEVSEAIKEFGVNAATAGISIEQSVAAIETLGEKGLKGSRAGVLFRNVLLKLASGADETNPEIVGLSKALDNLAKQNLSTAEMTRMFGERNLIAARILTQNRQRVDELTKALTGTNIAYEQQRVNTDNLNSDIKMLGSSWEKFVLNLNKGEGTISNFFRNAVQSVTKFVDMLDMANKSITELKNNVWQESLSESAKEDIKEFELYVDKLKISKNNLDELTEASERFLSVDKERLQQMLKSKSYDRNQVRLLQNRIQSIQDYVNSQSKIQPAQTISTALEPEAETMLTKITAAAPKVFNININNLVETFNVTSTTIKEGAIDVRKQIEQALAEALTDVQALAG